MIIPPATFMLFGCLYLYSKKTDVPIYSFEKHAREDATSTIYSPHVLILEGIFALHDQRMLDILDLRVRIYAQTLLQSSLTHQFRYLPKLMVISVSHEGVRISET